MRLSATLAAVAVLAAFTSSAYAAGSAAGGVEDVQVSASGNGYVRIKIAGASINPDSCTSGNTNLFYAEKTGNDFFDAFLSIAMTAKAADDELLVGVSGCVTIGGSTFPKINYVRF